MIPWLLALLACAPDDACAEAERFEPTLELGQGVEAFEELPDGASLVAASGPQGGHHLWASLRAEGLAVGTKRVVGDDEPAPSAEISLTGGDGAVWGEGLRQNRPWQGDAQQSETIGIQVFLVRGWPSEELVLEAVVEDGCGTEVSDRRTVTVR